MVDRRGGTTLSLTPSNIQALPLPPGPPPPRAKNASEVRAPVTNALQNVATYVLDTLGRVTELDLPLIPPSTWDRDATGQIVDAVDPLGRRTTYTLDYRYHRPDVVRIDYADGGTEQFQYSPSYPKVTVHQDQLNRLTTFAYTAAGDLSTITDPFNKVTAFLWGDSTTAYNGLLSTLTDSDQHTTTNLFDPITRRLQVQIDANQGRTSFLYDPAGNTKSVQDPDGHYVSSTFDPMRRPLTRADAAGTTSMLYDALGNLTQLTDANNHTTTFLFNALDRQTGTIDALRHLSTTLYDAEGNVTGVYDQLRRLTSFAYDALNRRVQTTEAAHLPPGTPPRRVTTTLYDAVGNVTLVTDGNGNATQFQYDARNRRNVVIDALGDTTTTLYDLAGNVTGVQAPQRLGVNDLTSYLYDADNRLTDTIDPLVEGVKRLYDAFGNLTGVFDTANRLTSFIFDALNRLAVRTIDAGGNWSETTTTLYDAAGNVTGVQAPKIGTLNDLTCYLYDAANRLTQIVDDLGENTEKYYDPVGNVTGIFDHKNRLTSFSYDALNRETARTEDATNPTQSRTTTTLYDFVGNVTGTQTPPLNGQTQPELTQFLVDDLNRKTVTIDALGDRTTTLYDAADNVTGIYDPNNNLTSFSYDPLNREIARTEAYGTLIARTEQTLYDADGNVTETINARGYATSFLYDALNRQTVTIDALGNRTTALYDPAGNLTGTLTPPVNGLNNLTQFSYDDDNRRTLVIDPLGNRVTTLYDAENNITGIYDQLNRLTSFGYDGLNRETVRIEAYGTLIARTTTTLYDMEGNISGVLAPQVGTQNNLTQFLFDDYNRQTEVIDPLGNQTTTLYDAEGNVTGVYDQLNRLTSFSYDALNRRVATTEAAAPGNNPLRRTTTNLYDPAGNLTGIQQAAVDGSGVRLTSFSYDALNRRVATTEGAQLASGNPARRTTTTLYDAVDNVTGIIDPDGNQTGYLFDKLNRQTVTIDPLNQRTSTLYDAVGNVTQVTDRNNRVRQFQYDALNRFRKEVWLNGSGVPFATFSYDFDPASQLTGANDSNSVYGYAFDALGRVTQLSNLGTPNAPTVTFTQAFDPQDRRISLAATINGTADFTNAYGYDALGRMTAVSQTGTGVATKYVTMAYYADNQFQLISRYRDTGGTQLVALTSYAQTDGLGRLTGLTHKNATGTITQDGWLYDAGDRVTQMSTVDGTRTFAYDAVDQLTGATTGSTASETYTYDPNGNRQLAGTFTYGTPQDNRVKDDGVYTYAYDNEGNRTSRTLKGTNQLTSYLWDYRNRLTHEITWNGAVTIMEATYTYDVFDRRIGKAVAGQPSRQYAYDGDNIALEFGTNGGLTTLTHRFLDGPSVDQVFADEQLSGAGPGTNNWLLGDNLGTVRHIVDNNGVVQNTLTYDAFGRILTGTPAYDAFAFTGREWDQETGQYFYRGRYYDPFTGCFESEDPTGLGPDVNLYRYVGNSPTNATDPSGLVPEWLEDVARGAARASVDLAKVMVSGLAPNVARVVFRPEYQLPPEMDPLGVTGPPGLQRAVQKVGQFVVDELREPANYLVDPLISRTPEQHEARAARVLEFGVFVADTVSMGALSGVAAYAEGQQTGNWKPFREWVGGFLVQAGLMAGTWYAGRGAGAARESSPGFGRLVEDSSLPPGLRLGSRRPRGGLAALQRAVEEAGGRLPGPEEFTHEQVAADIKAVPPHYAEGFAPQKTPAELFIEQNQTKLSRPPKDRKPIDIQIEQTRPTPPEPEIFVNGVEGALKGPGGGMGGRASRSWQQRALEQDLAAAAKLGATDIRIRQTQVNAEGTQVGFNKPDLQFTIEVNGTKRRVYIEYDDLRPPSQYRGNNHYDRILANDPDAIVILRSQ
jgi:RHS repeat-associated protein